MVIFNHGVAMEDKGEEVRERKKVAWE